MSQLTDNLSAIASIKSAIATAIESKGVSMAGVSFGSYADKIGEITTTFVTEPLSVSSNGTYNPGQGVDGFSQVVVNVPQSVIGITEKDYTEGNVQIVNLSNSASFVKAQAFTQVSTLLTVYLPECTNVSEQAFFYCSNLSTVYLPSCLYVGSSAFYSCYSLSSLYLPSCQYISMAAFTYCTGLTSVDLPNCQYIYSSAFYRCSNLTYISLPQCRQILGDAWQTYGAFGEANLSSVNLPVCSWISNHAFRYNRNLSQITLGSTAVCTLMNTNVFTGTPISSGTGSIYVPASLVDAYKAANNWSVYSSRIFPIPE